MLDYIQKMMSETDGTPCSTRWMSFVALLAGVAVAAIGMKMNKDMTGLSLLVGVFVGGAFGGKVAQSSIENRQ